MQIPCEVPKGSGADIYLVRFQKFPAQVLGEVPEGYGADTWLSSRGFWCRCPGEVPEVSGAAT